MRRGVPVITRPPIDQVEFYADRMKPYRIDIFRMWVNGGTRKDIAQAFNIPIGTAKSRIFRAFAEFNKLREIDQKANELA